MERLTKRELLAGHYVAFVSDEDCFDMWSVPKKFMGNAIDRLAAIEDILGDTYDLDRLRELMEADKDGRCVVPPCKNGDSVWYITPQGELCEARVIGIWLNIYTNPQLWIEITYFSNLTGQCDFKSRIDLIFGKTVFLTKEAAEAAMGKGDE